MSYLKGEFKGGTDTTGNKRLLGVYSGNAGSSPMARQRYAKGGAVGGNPALSEGVAASGLHTDGPSGKPSRPSLSRPGRKMGGKGGGKTSKNAGTHVTVISMREPQPHAPGAGAPGAVAGMPPPAMPHPMPPPPAAGPPMGGPGGPPMGPMPPRKYGGAVGRYAHGGKILAKRLKKDAEAVEKHEENEGEYARGGEVHHHSHHDKHHHHDKHDHDHKHKHHHKHGHDHKHHHGHDHEHDHKHGHGHGHKEHHHHEHHHLHLKKGGKVHHQRRAHGGQVFTKGYSKSDEAAKITSEEESASKYARGGAAYREGGAPGMPMGKGGEPGIGASTAEGRVDAARRNKALAGK